MGGIMGKQGHTVVSGAVESVPPLRLLMVEDEQLTLRGLLRSIPWVSLGIEDIKTADNGEAGLKMAREFKPAVILSDVRMPRMDGIKMAFEIRKELPNCHFIFISGFSEKEYLKSAITLSAVDYIEKPIEIDEIIEALKKAVDWVKKGWRIREQERFLARTNIAGNAGPEYGFSSGNLTDRIEKYICDHFRDPLFSLQSMADVLGFSVQHLCSVYKCGCHDTIHSLVLKKRITWAKGYLLSIPGVSIKDAAARAGFSSSNYFIKVFKKYEHCTPVDFMRERSCER